MKLFLLAIKPLIFIFILMFYSPSFGAADNSPPFYPVKLIFIHHSTGGNLLTAPNNDQPYGGLGTALMDNNYFVSATNYGWGPDSIGDTTDIPNWPEWFTGANSSTILTALYNESDQNFGDFGSWPRLETDPGGENEIILFKSCFPNSDLYGNPNDSAGDIPGDAYTISNAKAVYNNLLTYFQTRTDKLFVVITAPPMNENDYTADIQSADDRSSNARAFNNWLLNDWLSGYPHKNVAVFDYFNVLTASDNHHRWADNLVQHVINTDNNYLAYPVNSYDSHPSSTGHQKAVSEFVDILNYYYNRWKDNAGTTWAALTKTQVSQLYVGVFGRASEGDGNAYWRSDPNSTSMTATANLMLNTEAAQTYFDSTLNNNQDFIEHIYLNTLGKTYADDPEGINYWVKELNDGKTKGEVIAALIVAAQTPENAGAAQDQFNNKVEVSDYCADTIPIFIDLDTFTGFILSVTDDLNSITYAKNLIITCANTNHKPIASSISLNIDSSIPYLEQQLIGRDPDGDIITYELISSATGIGYSSAYVHPVTQGCLTLQMNPVGMIPLH